MGRFTEASKLKSKCRRGHQTHSPRQQSNEWLGVSLREHAHNAVTATPSPRRRGRLGHVRKRPVVLVPWMPLRRQRRLPGPDRLGVCEVARNIHARCPRRYVHRSLLLRLERLLLLRRRQRGILSMVFALSLCCGCGCCGGGGNGGWRRRGGACHTKLRLAFQHSCCARRWRRHSVCGWWGMAVACEGWRRGKGDGANKRPRCPARRMRARVRKCYACACVCVCVNVCVRGKGHVRAIVR